jgi:hypothetical protein
MTIFLIKPPLLLRIFVLRTSKMRGFFDFYRPVAVGEKVVDKNQKKIF